MGNKIFWCKHCLNMSTRPRIQFDERGWCNACQWMEEKKRLDWSARKQELHDLAERFRNTDNFDCIVPVSGGKDGSYVAYVLKHRLNLNPLCVTIKPPLALELGNANLENFIKSGYTHIHVSPDVNIMRQLNKFGFIEKGLPYYGWLIALSTAVIRVAINFHVPLIFYGEDGEVEYGGATDTKNKSMKNVDIVKRVYLEGGYDDALSKVEANSADLQFWKFPVKEIKEKNIYHTHMSYFEPWDSYRNYLVAKEHCGLREKTDCNPGTFTNFAQNDQALYALHTYMMYLKFGFGRATQDGGVEIRRGAMTREQAVPLVRLYDNHYPENIIDQYLEYYKMTKEEFDTVLDKYANRNLFNKINGRWEPTFEIV